MDTEEPIVPVDSPTSWKSIVLSVLIPLVVLLLIIAAIFLAAKQFMQQRQQQNQITSQVVASASKTIGGRIDFDGYIPPGSTIAIGERTTGTSPFTMVAYTDAADGATWSWHDAKQNVSYDLQAYLQNNGTVISSSSILTVAAPAENEVLRIVSTAKAPAVKAQISGQMDLNGYIPPGATITILAKKQSDIQFKTVASNIYAQDGAVWTWNSADEGIPYQMQAVLMQNGVIITSSAIQSLTAPSENESFTINSTATPPAPAQVGISGTIDLNGIAPANSGIAVGVRPSGTSQFTTVSTGIPVADGSVWNWNSAQSGTSYDIQASVMVNGNTVAQSQILTVEAPAANEVLTINIAAPPAAPGANTMTNSCVSQNSSTNLWQVQVTINNNNVISSAQQYMLTIGTNSGGNQIVSQTITPGNNSGQAQTYTTGFVFTTGVTYYAQWAYATCTNCTNFSAFSPSLQFYCTTPPPTNTPTPSLTPTPTQVPTATPVPTNTPTPTPSPTPLPPTNSPSLPQ